MRLSLARRLVLLALLVVSVSARAQTVRGRVVGADSTHGVAGTVVQLVDGAGRDVARSISDETGAFALRAPAAGSYSVRTLRIGFTPGTFGPYALSAGVATDAVLVLRELPAQLGAIRVTGRNECRVRAESGPAALALWEQARTALLAALVSREGQRMMVTTVHYLRVTERLGDKTARLTLQHASGASDRPFGAARPPDEYATAGFRGSGPDGPLLYGPDADVLLAESFGANHCFRVDPSSDDRRDEIGLQFEPLPGRSSIVDVAGTLWLGRADAALRRLEYRYTNTGNPEQFAPTGNVQFARLANGLWVIPSWEIDAPSVQMGPTAPGVYNDPIVREVWRSGGAIVDARAGEKVLWSGAAGVVEGVVTEEGTDRPVAGAAVSLDGTDYGAITDSAGRFTIADVLPGRYVAAARSASAEMFGLRATRGTPLVVRDSVTTTVQLRAPNASQALDRACNAPIAASRHSMLTGVVRDSAGVPVPRLALTASWVDSYDIHGNAVSQANREADATTDSAGRFTICGVARERPIVLRVPRGGSRGDSAIVRLDGGDLVGRVELRLRAAPRPPTGPARDPGAQTQDQALPDSTPYKARLDRGRHAP